MHLEGEGMGGALPLPPLKSGRRKELEQQSQSFFQFFRKTIWVRAEFNSGPREATERVPDAVEAVEGVKEHLSFCPTHRQK
jgi:hypothetical protein